MTATHIAPADDRRTGRPLSAGLLLAGAGGTVLLILSAVVRVFSTTRVLDRLPELPIVTVLWLVIAAWMLSPFLGAAQMRRSLPRGLWNEVVLSIALLLMVALAATSFLATSAFVGGDPHPTADGVTILLIPLLQWVLLAAAAVTIAIRARIAERRPPS